MLTAVRPETFKQLQLNAGAFLLNFDYASYNDATALLEAIKAQIQSGEGLLGATRGGGTFQATPDMRAIEADGKRYEFVGSRINDGWTVRMTGTLIEVTPENMKYLLVSADIAGEKGAKKRTLKLRTDIADTDYVDHLIWVGDTSNGVVLIDLHKALNITGANMTFTDKGEGTLPFEFHAHQDDVLNIDYAPVEIIFFEKASA